MKRIISAIIGVTVVTLLVTGISWFPLGGRIWTSAQITSATIDNRQVPKAKLPKLLADLKNHRFEDPCKCAGFVTLVLTDGTKLEYRMDCFTATQEWGDYCGI
ncbi:MAG TPA: hypothetical protein VGK74_13515 [Symbiobacteriaceae bacterium]|jgi:hypothetical protein